MENYKQQFIEFALARQVLKFGEFTLKSGRVSPYFFNAGLFNQGADLARLGEFYAAALQAGIPIATTVSIALFNCFNVNKPVCFNRKEAKDHGEGGNLIGSPLQGKVLLVDDVITAGTAIRESMQIIQANGAQLSAVLIALNRQERGNGELSAIQEVERDYQCNVLSIVDFADLMAFIKTQPEYQQYLPAMRAYRAQYGIK